MGEPASREPEPNAPLTFESVYAEHRAAVGRALRFFGVAESSIPDMTQEVFLVVHRRLQDFEGRSSVRTWLFGIARGIAANHRRLAHVRHERPEESPAQEEGDGVDVEGLVERRQRVTQLLALLDQLPTEPRELFVLFEIEGLSMKDAADVIGCSLATAYRWHRLAREEVVGAYQARHGGGR
ncbi:MAG: RNA polymerase sigma factor [Sandaracinus sp.]|nr:RNA polymerase sigma factor [Sandaracinus sp.]MCB9613211.1 RNA polymerase sigma factor [Sandaracinus sp.]